MRYSKSFIHSHSHNHVVEVRRPEALTRRCCRAAGTAHNLSPSLACTDRPEQRLMEALLTFPEYYLYLDTDQFKFNMWKTVIERQDYQESTEAGVNCL